MDPAHGSSLNKDKEYKEDKENEVSKMTSENSNAKSDQPDDRKFLIPHEHIKRNRKKQNQVITKKGSSKVSLSELTGLKNQYQSSLSFKF